MFRALLAHPQEALHKWHLVYCVRVMSVGFPMIGAADWHNTHAIYQVPIHTKCPTRCNTNILILLQDHYTCFETRQTKEIYQYKNIKRKLHKTNATIWYNKTCWQYVVPVVVNCSYCTPDDGYGKYAKHVKWSCSKIKILVLHLVGHFVCVYIENDARNHEPKIPSAVCVAPPEVEQAMLETCSGPKFLINWINSASRMYYIAVCRQLALGETVDQS
jgi:hypothetical protein